MKKNSIIILYSLVGLCLFSLGFFIISFVYSSIENISVMGFTSRIDEYNRREKEFLKLEKDYNDWQNIDEIFAKFKEDYVIKFDDYPDFRNELQSVLARNGLQISDTKHKYRNIMEDIRVISLDFKLRGSYMNVKKFILEMENKNKMVLFKDLYLTKKESINVCARISMEVYFVR